MNTAAPVGIYIHVPFCAKKCPYCDFYSLPYRQTAAHEYTDALCRNITALPRHIMADTVYFGGGTPSLLTEDALKRIMEALQNNVSLTAHAEITLEANPCTMTAKALAGWHRAGINRLSVGVQSFCDEELRLLGRNHSAEQAAAAICRAADAGFANISADLMLGTPMQTEASLADSIAKAVSLPVQHLSAYLLKIEEGTAFGQNPPAVADDDTAADRYHQLSAAMKAAGFVHYEISNYAQPGFESRHNLKYWRCEPYIGLGPAAHSCYGGKRTYVPASLEDFLNAPLQPVQVESETACDTEERIMLGLRLKKGICPDDFPHLRDALLRLAKPLIPRYLQLREGRLHLTEKGMAVSNAVIAHLLQALDA